ncbi:hypothetical protein PR048_019485 [Dryococelus australis]|uniref:Integrase catalytic domain-containing protein n=1 Tax=Dryococelus australis TaxID=614101 RepID=A0ABQ9H3X0_9NEOP|nr:hypothetical protein PR048_019485 [Dryococelus australis]
MPKTSSGNKYILTIIDHFSRYLVTKPLPDETAETLCQLLHVKKLTTTPGHPQGNGRTERLHRTIAKMISHYVSSKHDYWDVYLPYVCAAYNSQVHTSTQLSPYEVHGMKMSTPYEHLTLPPAVSNSHVVEVARKFHYVWKSVKQGNSSTFLHQTAQYNKKAVNSQYKVGDLVYLKNPVLKKNQVQKKFQQSWKGPYPVIEVCSPVTLKLHLPFRSVIVHVNRMKQYTGPATLPASATDDQDHPRRRPCKLPPGSPTAEIIVQPSNVGSVFEHQSDVVVSDSEYIVVDNFNISALSEECHLLEIC